MGGFLIVAVLGSSSKTETAATTTATTARVPTILGLETDNTNHHYNVMVVDHHAIQITIIFFGHIRRRRLLLYYGPPENAISQSALTRAVVFDENPNGDAVCGHRRVLICAALCRRNPGNGETGRRGVFAIIVPRFRNNRSRQ